MKIWKRSVLLVVLVAILIVASQQVALGALFRRGGSDTWYDFRVCTDGIVAGIAISPNKYDAGNPPTLQGELLLDGSTALNLFEINTLTLETLSEPIPGLPGSSYWMGYPVASWTKVLAPGSRVKLQLDVPNSDVISSIYVTVENCLTSDPLPDTESVLFQGQSQQSIPANGELVTTIPANWDKPIGKVRVAMYLNLRGGNTDVEASLVSPSGTTVRLFQVFDPSVSYKFGSRCDFQDGDLVGDYMADFVLDSSSTFQFGDASVTPPFVNTAVAPDEPLTRYLGESVSGDWRLVVNNRAGADGSLLECWFLEFTEGTATPTNTPTATATNTPTATATNTPTATATNTPTATATNTPTATATNTPTTTATNTPTAVPPTNTPTATPTEDPPTNTPTATPTEVPSTNTPTATSTEVPPTNTATATVTATSTTTATVTNTPTVTGTPAKTPTAVATSTATPSPPNLEPMQFLPLVIGGAGVQTAAAVVSEGN
jgi:hypothetical protein